MMLIGTSVSITLIMVRPILSSSLASMHINGMISMKTRLIVIAPIQLIIQNQM